MEFRRVLFRSAMASKAKKTARKARKPVAKPAAKSGTKAKVVKAKPRRRAEGASAAAAGIARAAARSVRGGRKPAAGIAKPHVAKPGDPVRIGVLGGSGIYGMAGLQNTQWRKVATPWGDTSDEIGRAHV